MANPPNWWCLNACLGNIWSPPLQKLAPQDSFGEINLPSSQPTLIGIGPRRGDSDPAEQDSPPWEGLGEASLCLVESEKTALIMSLVCPDRVWLATGGKANFKAEMLVPLLGHDVAVYPDADALRDWQQRIQQLNREQGHRLYIPTGYYNLMDHDRPRSEGWDLADILLG